MRFVDFSIRAWRETGILQVIAHSTPAGGMRQPVTVKLSPFRPEDYRIPYDAPLDQGAEIGRELARLLFPDKIWGLLGDSLRVIAPDPQLGLRLRLCLDADMIDLPWEFLYRPDVDTLVSRSGFLLMDGRISLVREPPTLVTTTTPSDRIQRGLFVGTQFENGADLWGVKTEYQSLITAMHPVKDLLTFDYVSADKSISINKTLKAGCDLFHYAGHTEVESNRGVLIQLARQHGDSTVDASGERASWAWSDKLAMLLSASGTRLAVFNACNSGFWPFIRPFISAGIRAVVGVQGLVSNIAALNFTEKLYESLAVGLSLDEALTYARLYVLEPKRSYYDCDWGRFMVYMPTESSVLFPRSEREPIQHQQRKIRKARQQTIVDAQTLIEKLDGAGVSNVLSEIAKSSVLILGRFSKSRKPVLDALCKALTTPPRQYIPVLFDFDKPNHRDLIESIVSFAGVSRFVIADLSDPKSIPAELQAIVPLFPSLPVIPIIEFSQFEYAVSDHILRRESVAEPVVKYQDTEHLLDILDEQILAPAELLYEQLRPAVIN